ncbi:MAG TPA: 2-amino-4-hydroxy-6-hydroxymethyldihydropteridine diphosphokinase [Polyangia bacterium]|nr:2-amino-4-hydroxy-6-hydroxymethyldihydropteridine diphosphokinase [Polyangia bacterium]
MVLPRDVNSNGERTTAYLALGSNLGDRKALISAALERLEGAGVHVAARSPLYETDPVTPDPQPLYLNGAARLETTLSARALLDLCLAIERDLGRERLAGASTPAPRPIDLDVLLYGDAVIDEPGLLVPHPRLLARAFVRIPLAAVAAPGLRHPVTGDALDRAITEPGVRLQA